MTLTSVLRSLSSQVGTRLPRLQGVVVNACPGGSAQECRVSGPVAAWYECPIDFPVIASCCPGVVTGTLFNPGAISLGGPPLWQAGHRLPGGVAFFSRWVVRCLPLSHILSVPGSQTSLHSHCLCHSHPRLDSCVIVGVVVVFSRVNMAIAIYLYHLV